MTKHINSNALAKSAILEEIFGKFFNNFQYVDVKRFRVSHRDQLQVIDDLVSEGMLQETEGKYEFHLRAYVESKWWNREKDALEVVFTVLQRLYSDNPDGSYKCDDVIANAIAIDNKRLLQPEVEKAITLSERLGLIGGGTLASTTGPRKYISFHIREDVLRYKSIDERIRVGIEKQAHMLTYPSKATQSGSSFFKDLNKLSMFDPPKAIVALDKEVDKVFETISDTYRFILSVGEGGAGLVYKVRNQEGAEFALKYLPPSKVTSEKVKRFKNEMFFARRILTHIF